MNFNFFQVNFRIFKINEKDIIKPSREMQFIYEYYLKIIITILDKIDI